MHRMSENKVGVQGMLCLDVSNREGFDHSHLGEGRRDGGKTLGEVLTTTENVLWLFSFPSHKWAKRIGENESPGVSWWTLITNRWKQDFWRLWWNMHKRTKLFVFVGKLTFLFNCENCTVLMVNYQAPMVTGLLAAAWALLMPSEANLPFKWMAANSGSTYGFWNRSINSFCLVSHLWQEKSTSWLAPQICIW